MGTRASGRLSKTLTWTTALLMTIAAIALIDTSLGLPI
jgi:hypothetical protein